MTKKSRYMQVQLLRKMMFTLTDAQEVIHKHKSWEARHDSDISS